LTFSIVIGVPGPLSKTSRLVRAGLLLKKAGLVGVTPPRDRPAWATCSAADCAADTDCGLSMRKRKPGPGFSPLP
jgi:hypothetical protein